jgi:integrase
MATIDQRKGNWRAQVRRRGVKPQCRTFKTKAQAQAWARKVEADLDRGVSYDITALRSSTVADLFNRFLESVVDSRKGSRWERVRIEKFLRDSDFVHSTLDSDVAGRLRAWVEARANEVSAASVNRELNLIGGIFTHAIKAWGIPMHVNPVSLVKRPRMSSKGRERVWTAEDVARFRAAYQELGCDVRHGRGIDFTLPALELGIETAMRLGEICSIRTDDVDIAHRVVRLRMTKNGDARDVPLSMAAVHILEPLVNLAQPGSLVIPVSAESLGTEFRIVRNRAGLHGLRFHDSRHTAATRISKKLSNVLELSAVTGHRDLRSLKRYYNPDASELALRLD